MFDLYNCDNDCDSAAVPIFIIDAMGSHCRITERANKVLGINGRSSIKLRYETSDKLKYVSHEDKPGILNIVKQQSCSIDFENVAFGEEFYSDRKETFHTIFDTLDIVGTSEKTKLYYTFNQKVGAF